MTCWVFGDQNTLLEYSDFENSKSIQFDVDVSEWVFSLFMLPIFSCHIESVIMKSSEEQ